jgi:hypothetical protein
MCEFHIGFITCNEHGIKSYLFIPEEVPHALRILIQASGDGNIFVVQTKYCQHREAYTEIPGDNYANAIGPPILSP